MPAHTHDGIDWVARLADLRQADAANGPAMRAVADRLIESLPAPQPTVMDVGCGAGGMSAALAAALAGRAARSPTHSPAPDNITVPTDDNTIPGTSIFSIVSHTSHPAQPARTTADIGLTTGSASEPATTGSLASGESADGWPAQGAGTAGGVGLAGGSATAGLSGSLGSGAVSGERADVSLTQGAGVSGSPGSGAASGELVGGWPAGGTLVLVDMVPELLAAAVEITMAAAGVSGAVEVRALQADIADHGTFGGLAGAADLVWASNVAHHLPDQRRAVATLVGLLAPGGCLAMAEGGLSMRCLPWDVGVGEPGLQDRLIAAHGIWFHRMRSEMVGAVRMPVGWNQVLTEAGLSGVTAFSYLVDVPAPLSDAGRAAVVSWLAWMTRATAELLDPADVVALNRLLDPSDAAYVGLRDDVFMLKASTVYRGWR